MTKSKFLKAAVCMAALLSAACSFAQTFIVEAENFQFSGDWTKTYIKGARGLHSRSSGTQVVTVIEVKDAGEYSVWSNTIDYATNAPRTRNFHVLIDGKALPNKSGVHGREGLYWEKLGAVKLEKGDHYITLRPSGHYIRTDALLFTTDASLDPNKEELQRDKINLKPKIVQSRYTNAFPEIPALEEVKGGKKFEIKNADCKIVFFQAKDSNGKTAFQRGVEIIINSKWTKLPPFKDELVFISSASKARFSSGGYTGAWIQAESKLVADISEGVQLELPVAPVDPYSAGKVTPLRVRSITKTDARTLRLVFDEGVSGVLSLPERGQAARLDLEYEAPEKGFYSFAIKTGYELERADVRASFLPTIYQGRRLMREPRLVATAMTSQPLAMLQSTVTDEKFNVTCGVSANPDFLPQDWGQKSLYGFSLASPSNKAQTAAFQPILGGPDSSKDSGEILKASFYLYNVAGDWRNAIAYANSRVFAGARLREAFDTSFSDAVANLAEYLKRGEYSGWAPKHKGRWNIEGEDMATHSVPLAEVSAAILTNDEEHYRNIALPAIEFSLSRKSWHFITIEESNEGYGKKLYELTVPNGALRADYFMSLNALLGNSNPWLEEFTKDQNGKLRLHSGRIAPWNTKLGMYIAKPDAKLLEEIKTEADEWMKKAFAPQASNEPDFVAFINSGLYPYWWYLPDLYEITKDKKYLDYAEKGAFFSLSSLWNWPTPPEGDVVINKDNFVNGVTAMWWKGIIKERVGYDTSKAVIKMLTDIDRKHVKGNFVIPEKTVPADKVSRIGMGIEQHSTYVGGNSNILMPSWSPEMLKVAQYTGRDILMKFSRHSIIGRYANFLGYYFRDFTDVQHDEMYPYVGPDTTSLYYHHAPCHFAQSMDYLMAQIEVASKNKIKFPHLRGQGYVWFTDRVFGLPGKIFGEDGCRPLLDKKAARPDSPKVSTLVARGKESIWIVALNDSGKALDVALNLDLSAKSMRGALADRPVEVYNADGEKLPESFGLWGDKKVKIPAMSLVALRIAAEKAEASYASKPLENAHKSVKDFAEGWGDLHVFRIRGPFGKDSLFAVFTGAHGKKDARVEFEINGAKVSRDFFPYETSVYPISQESDIVFKARVYEGGKLVKTSEEISLQK